MYSEEGARHVRLAETIQVALAELLLKRAHDPRFASITVSLVDLSPDGRNAKVFVVLSQATQFEKKAVLAALTKAAGFFRSALAKTLNFRITPRLSFVADEHPERVSHLLKVIEQANATNLSSQEDETQ